MMDRLAPGDGGEGVGEEGAPGHEPDEEEGVEEQEGDGVVVAGDAEVEIAEEVLVDEVEPGPAVDVAVGGERHEPVAVGKGDGAGVATRGVAEAGEDVPGGGDEEKYGGAGGGVEGAEVAEEVAGAVEKGEVEEDDGDGEDDADEALGEDIERAGGGEARAKEARRGGELGVAPVDVEGEGDPEADGGVGDGDAGEDEDAEGGEGDERGVEAGAGGVKGAAGEGLEGQGEEEDGEGKGEAGGWGGDAEDAHARGHGPVEEGGFLEVADAVGVEGDPVVAEEHLAADLGVDRVGVVEQGRGGEGEGRVEEEPEGEGDEAVAGGAGAGVAEHGIQGIA